MFTLAQHSRPVVRDYESKCLLLLFFTITGIPPTEEQALRSRGEDYRRYQQETSIFVPWFPRRS